MKKNYASIGWSVVLHEDYIDRSLPAIYVAQGLFKSEAIDLAMAIFENRNKRPLVEVLDITDTTRFYISPQRPQGFHG